MLCEPRTITAVFEEYALLGNTFSFILSKTVHAFELACIPFCSLCFGLASESKHVQQIFLLMRCVIASLQILGYHSNEMSYNAFT